MNALTQIKNVRNEEPTLVNYEAEAALLAAVFARNDLWFKASAIIRPECFADALHGRIFAAQGKLIQAGQLANPLTMRAEFDRDPALITAGGGAYLARLASNVVTLFVEDFALVLRDLWLRREIVAYADKMRGDMDEVDRPADEAIAEMIADLHRLSKDGRRTARTKREIAEEMVNAMQRPPERYSTGIPSLDNAMGGGLYAGKLYGISGRKKAGKSALAGTISYNLDRQSIPHLFVALEMSPIELLQRDTARHLGVNSMQFLRNPQKDLARRAAEYACSLGDSTIYEASPGATLQELQRMIGSAIVQHGIKGCFVDYWQLVSGKGKNETEEYHSRIVAQWLADCARKHGIWIVLGCQLNQEGNTRGGEGIRLACDMLLALHREKGSSQAWLEMQETRYTPFHNLGSEMEAGLWFHQDGPYFDEAPPPIRDDER